MPPRASLCPFATLVAVGTLVLAAPAAAQGPEPVAPSPQVGPEEAPSPGVGPAVGATRVAAPAAEPIPEEPEEEPSTASEGDGDPTLNNTLLLSASALSLVLAPTSIALLNDDMSFTEALQVSVAGSFGVFCASAGTTLAVFGGGLIVASLFYAIFDEDGAGEFLAFGALMAGVGVGLFFLSPLVFSLAAEADGGFGDTAGEIAVVSTTSTLAAGLATLVGIWTVDDIAAEGWIKVVAVAAFALLAANVTYGATRALMFEEPGSAMAPLLPPMRF